MPDFEKRSYTIEAAASVAGITESEVWLLIQVERLIPTKQNGEWQIPCDQVKGLRLEKLLKTSIAHLVDELEDLETFAVAAEVVLSPDGRLSLIEGTSTGAPGDQRPITEEERDLANTEILSLIQRLAEKELKRRGYLSQGPPLPRRTRSSKNC